MLLRGHDLKSDQINHEDLQVIGCVGKIHI